MRDGQNVYVCKALHRRYWKVGYFCGCFFKIARVCMDGNLGSGCLYFWVYR